MRLSHSEEHEDLRKSVRRLLEARGSLERTRANVEGGAGHDSQLWKEMAQDLGLHGLAIDEECGGSGFGLVELSVVLEEMGRQCLATPFFSTVVLAATVLSEADPGPARDAWLSAVASGDLVATVASAEADGDWMGPSSATRAEIDQEHAVLNGTKHFVTDAAASDLLLVLADGGNGRVLVGVDAHQPGVVVTDLPVLDTTRPMGRVELSNATGVVLTSGAETEAVLERLRDVALAALAAEQVGGAQRALEMAVEYAKVREQFGVPIGSFQGIKFKAADMLLQMEAARSAAMYAARAVADRAEDAAVSAAVAKAVCSEAFFAIAAESIQIHGGIGFTWEHDAHYYLKRAKSSELFLGTPDGHRERLVALLGW